MPNKKIDSNVAGLSFAQEASLKTLPGSPKWYGLEPNEYDDFGGEISTVARNPINASRQRKKGVVTDLEASGGFNSDITQSNLTRLMQGFFFSDAHERPNSQNINDKATTKVTQSNFAAGSNITVAVGDGAKFKVGMLLKTSGNAVAANNQDLIEVLSITGDVLGTSATFVVEVLSATSKLEVIGFELADNTAAITVAGSLVQLTRSAGTFLDFALNVGEWIFVGGDAAGNTFTNNRGYARVKAIAAGALTLDECSWTPIAEPAAVGKQIQIFTGTFLRNEKTSSLIKTRSYQLERSLGQDDNGTQSEYLVGAIANEFSLNIPSADKLNADLSFVAMDNELRDGTAGLKAGDRVSPPVEDAFNTSSNIYQMRLYVHDAAAVTPASLFAYVTEASLVVNNNATGLKAIGVLGSFDVNVGDFEVGGELEVYFSTIAAVKAVRDNADVGFNLIAANNNAGFVYDIPLLSLGGGRVNVEKDEPIMLPVENMGAENTNGYTLSATYFSYLPNAAMAS